jgi:ribosome-associated heat shock protein Hsp15
MNDSNPAVRIDKWLWAARFYKTRSLAAQAVSGGRVHVNGQRVKPARALRVGDELRLTIGELEWTIHVRAVSDQRRGAPEAQGLYEEDQASRERRAETLAQRRARSAAYRVEGGRPTKKDRRMIRRFTEG